VDKRKRKKGKKKLTFFGEGYLYRVQWAQTRWARLQVLRWGTRLVVVVVERLYKRKREKTHFFLVSVSGAVGGDVGGTAR
jgi:hypothetical protein